jgi:hypothetical protein
VHGRCLLFYAGDKKRKKKFRGPVALTGVIWVENRDQIRPVAATAHCWGVEIASGGRLGVVKERATGGRGGA